MNDEDSRPISGDASLLQKQKSPVTLTGQWNRKTGEIGEKLAARHLERLGYRHVARNLRMGRMGELDLVSWAEDGRTLCFVEVKTRTSGIYGAPAEAVDFRKRLRIRKMAELWLNRCHADSITPDMPVRFDVVEVLLSREAHTARVHHIPDAF